MTTTSPRPSWQDDACPTWCVVEHSEDDHPDDRFHDSASTEIPVIAGPWTTGRELTVVTSRRCGTTDDWVYIGPPDDRRGGMTVSGESARRLAEGLALHLSSMGS